MSDNKHLDLINNLSDKLKPIDINWSAERRASIWFITHMVFTTLLMFVVKPFSINIINTRFLFELVLLTILIFTTGYVSFLTMVPGALNKDRLKFLAIPLMALLGFLFFGLTKSAPVMTPGSGRTFCELEIIGYSLIPLLHIFFLAKKGIFFNSRVSFLFSAMAAGLIPTAVMHIACAPNYKHILIWHVGTLGFVTVVFGSVFLKIHKSSGESKYFSIR